MLKSGKQDAYFTKNDNINTGTAVIDHYIFLSISVGSNKIHPVYVIGSIWFLVVMFMQRQIFVFSTSAGSYFGKINDSIICARINNCEKYSTIPQCDTIL